MSLITVNQLQKHFEITERQKGPLGSLVGLFYAPKKTVKAVDGISFQINEGELVSYLGPNGAGKSTTIKMLTGLLTPSQGEIHVAGFVPYRDRTRYVAQIGAVFGQRSTLWWDLPVVESLELLQFIYQVPGQRFHQNLAEFRDLLDLDPFLEMPVRSLSLGQRMRADLCAAMLHNPRILFLDEPTIGLDVVAKERIRQFIQHINQQNGVTVILTTHDLSDVEKLSERVMIIDHGKLLYDGSLDVLRNRFGGKRLLVVDFADQSPDFMIEGAEIASQDGLRVTYAFERSQLTASELINRIANRYRIHDLEVHEPEIEETVRRIYEQRLLEK